MRSTLIIPNEISKIMTKAKTQVVLDNFFYATLLLSSKCHYTASVPTAGTDGLEFFFNTEFVKGLTLKPLIGLIKHEILHKAFLHLTRRQGRNPKLWNVAADIVINGIIVKEGGELPPDPVIDRSLEHLMVEEIYAMMKEDLDKSEQQGKSGPGGAGDGGGDGDEEGQQGGGGGEGDEPDRKFAGKTASEWMDEAPDHLVLTPMTEEEARAVEAQVEIDVAKAVTMMKQAGQAGSPLLDYLAKLMEPKVDWKDRLRDFITMTGCDDYTFATPNRRYMAHGFYMPTVYGNEVGRVAILFDTSGSIFGYKTLLDQFCSEIDAICEDVHPEGVDVIYVDTAVAGHDTFERGEPFDPKIQGGGGTAFKSAFEYIHENLEEPPAIVIVFTDMEIFDLDECECDYPTLWMAYGSGQHPPEPPFGVVIPVED